MDQVKPWPTGAALALTVVIAYAACAAIFVAFPDASAAFLNALFHGLDFRKLQPAAGGFSLAGFGLSAAVLAVWAFLIGALFAGLHNLIGR
jgi:hypothetical protein